jgi:hypothetical protein
MTFWLNSNSFGQIKKSNVFQLKNALLLDFFTFEDEFDVSYKAAFIGNVASKNELFVNELYFRFVRQ